MNTRNRYKVPKKQWNKWGKLARYVFNETYEASLSPVLWPDSADILTSNAKKVISWNLSWIAADAVRVYENE